MGSVTEELQFGRRKVPFIQQSETSECGLACIAMVAAFHGYEVDLATLRRRFGVSLRGARLSDLIEIAEPIGFNSNAVRAEPDELDQLALPAILHWDLSHFVVLTKIGGGIRSPRYYIHDPGVGELVVDRKEFSRRWSGVALELVKSEKFQPVHQQAKLKITNLWTSTVGFWGMFGNILFLSLILQVIALAMPFYLQIAIDTVLPSADDRLLLVLALGFGGLALVDMLTGWIRSFMLVHLSSALSFQIIVNLFRHMVRLPLAWFEKRHVGDVISRFGSTRPISDLISQGLVAAIIDGLMAFLTLVLMFVYSTTLASVALVALLLYFAVRMAFLHSIRLRNVDVITTAAKENSSFIETVRGITSIKAFGHEARRQNLWQKTKTNAVNAEIKLNRLTASFDAVGKLIVGGERVIFVYIAISHAFEGLMTIGMIFAFQAYKQQFLDASMRLVEQLINLKIINVHLARITDIALSPREVPDEHGSADTLDFSQPLVLKNVAYRYGENEEPVLRGLHLKVEEGETAIILGPSGGGKSTLLKIASGLLVPGQGTVELGPARIDGLARLRFRQSIGILTQGDTLYAGTLSENIAFFDPNLDLDRVREVAMIACIHAEIEAMPLGYETLVGDMGSTLSAGQLQRVLLARALYGDPKMLLLDEGTANLDPKVETEVIDALARLPMRKIIVAHRPQVLEIADSVYMMQFGALMPMDLQDKRQNARNTYGPPAPPQASTRHTSEKRAGAPSFQSSGIMPEPR